MFISALHLQCVTVYKCSIILKLSGSCGRGKSSTHNHTGEMSIIKDLCPVNHFPMLLHQCMLASVMGNYWALINSLLLLIIMPRQTYISCVL